MPAVRSMEITLAVRRIATGVAWTSIGISGATFLVDVDLAQYHLAIIPLGGIVIVLAFLSVKDSIERWVDAQAGKAIAERLIAELTLKATEDAVRAGQYRVTVHGERARAVN